MFFIIDNIIIIKKEMSRIPQHSRVMKKSSRKSSRKLNPPSIKLDRKAAVKAAREAAGQNQPLPAGLARELFPQGANRRLVL